MKTNLVRSCQLLLIVNAVFWLFMAFYSTFYQYAGNNNYPIVKLLLFMEVILYVISLVGVRKKIKFVYVCSIVLAFGNTLLSIADQIGVADVISFILSVLVLLNLLVSGSMFSEVSSVFCGVRNI